MSLICSSESHAAHRIIRLPQMQPLSYDCYGTVIELRKAFWLQFHTENCKGGTIKQKKKRLWITIKHLHINKLMTRPALECDWPIRLCIPSLGEGRKVDGGNWPTCTPFLQSSIPKSKSLRSSISLPTTVVKSRKSHLSMLLLLLLFLLLLLLV